MEIVRILAQEIAVMFLLIAAGVISRKKGIFTEDTARRICNFLLILVTPMMLLRSFQHEKQPELLRAFWVVLVVAVLVHLLAAALSVLLIRKPQGDGSAAVARMGVVFSNCGYMGIPLLLATIGETGRLYLSGYFGIFNIFLWTWAAFQLGGKKELSLKKALLNPGVIGVAIGLTVFLGGIKLPRVLFSFTDYMYTINMPLSMFAVGVFLSGINIREIMSDFRLFKVVFLRNVVVPLIVVALFYMTGFAGRFAEGRELVVAIVVATATPCAASCVLFPARFGADSALGAKLIAVSTLLSVVTLPAVAYLALTIL